MKKKKKKGEEYRRLQIDKGCCRQVPAQWSDSCSGAASEAHSDVSFVEKSHWRRMQQIVLSSSGGIRLLSFGFWALCRFIVHSLRRSCRFQR